MTGYWFAVGCSVALVLFLVFLLRTRRLREKYAFIWIAVAVVICVLGAVPDLVVTLARVAGVQTASNLLFAASLLVLLLVCIQLSVEVSTLEEETRTLAEEIALLRLDVERGPLRAADDDRAAGPAATDGP